MFIDKENSIGYPPVQVINLKRRKVNIFILLFDKVVDLKEQQNLKITIMSFTKPQRLYLSQLKMTYLFLSAIYLFN